MSAVNYDEIKKILLQLDSVKEIQDEDPSSYRLTLQEVVCPFFKKGNYPSCRTCIQPLSKLEECKELYETHIHTTPAHVWTPSFGAAKKRATEAFSSDTNVGLMCNTCYLADHCAKFEAGATCAVDWAEGCKEDAELALDHLIKLQHERVNRQAIAEKMDGGMPDRGLSDEMDRLANLYAIKRDIKADKFSLRIEGSSSGESSKGGGILSQVFGSMLGSKKTDALPEKAESIVELPVQDAELVTDKPKRRRRSTDDE